MRFLTALVFLLFGLSKAYAQEEGVVLYLTFDDGPNTVYDHYDQGPTPVLLDILDKYEVKATFFFPGESVNNWETELLVRVLVSGHAIGIHSYHHGASIEANGMSDQELADEYVSGYNRIRSILSEKSEALAIFDAQPPLYRRPGGSASLNQFLNPSTIGGLNLTMQEERLLRSTYDYSGWSLGLGDTVPAVLRQISLGDTLNGVSEEDQEAVTEALWSFLYSGRLPNGTKTNYPGLEALSTSPEGEEGLIILAHDNFMSSVQAWDVIIPLLKERGYTFEVLPRPVDQAGTYIMGMG